MWRVLKGFFDIADNNHWYEPGDQYPRSGYKPDEKRIALLAGDKNRQKTPLIVRASEDAPKDEAIREETPKKAAKKKKD